MKGKIIRTAELAGSILASFYELKGEGLCIGSVLISSGGASISLESGIEKAAGSMGADLYKSSSGTHLCFDAEGMHFAQRIRKEA